MTNKGCRFFGEEADFEYWYLNCVIAAINDEECPDDFKWDMKKEIEKGGEWLDMFRGGLSSKTAIAMKFKGLKLNDYKADGHNIE